MQYDHNMVREIEVKAKTQDISALKEKLLELGCSFSEPLTQHDTIYLPEGIQYPVQKKGMAVMRIRDQNGKLMLTMKKAIENELDNIEKEISFENKQEAHDMLCEMGYYAAVSVKKTRVKCKHEDVEICIDEVEGLGSFIEVEKLCEDDKDSEQVQEELFAFLQTLGVSQDDQVLKGYDTMMAEKNS